MSLTTLIKKELDAQERKRLATKRARDMMQLPSGSPERWRLAYENFLKQRPEAKGEALAIAKYVRERRANMDKYASTKNGRMVSSMPDYLPQILKLADPEYFNGKSKRQLNSGKHFNLVKKAFPEFFYAEVV